MNFELVESKPFSEAVHHALDQVILDEVERGVRKPTIRFWYRNSPAVPIGRFQSFYDEVNVDYVEDKGVEVVRRITGGGSMFVEPGKVITYSLYVPIDFVPDDFERSYEELDSWTVEGLNRCMDTDVYYEPLNDIVCCDGKLGGSAQLRRGSSVLHHATLNYGIDLREMLRCLRIGKDKLSDKAVKSAEKRVAPVGEHTSLNRREVEKEIIKVFEESATVERKEMDENLLTRAKELARNKFSLSSWNRMM